MGIDLGPRAKALAMLALVGALGVLVGIGVDRRLAEAAPPGVAAPAPRPHAPLRGEAASGPRGPGARSPMPHLRFSEQLAGELGLSPEQKAAIDAILAEERSRVRALMREYQPRFRAIVEDARRKIDAVLTEEQRERFRETREERLRLREWDASGRPPSWSGRGRRGETVPGEPRP